MKYYFRLYIAGMNPRSQRAIANLQRICAETLSGQCHTEIVDVVERPHLAEEARIVATPTLLKVGPLPTRRIVGDLSDMPRVLQGLDLPLHQPSVPSEGVRDE